MKFSAQQCQNKLLSNSILERDFLISIVLMKYKFIFILLLFQKVLAYQLMYKSYDLFDRNHIDQTLPTNKEGLTYQEIDLNTGDAAKKIEDVKKGLNETGEAAKKADKKQEGLNETLKENIESDTGWLAFANNFLEEYNKGCFNNDIKQRLNF